MTSGTGKVIFATGIDIGDGEIVITEYDNVNNTISGTFKFRAKNADGDSLAGDILNFQQGVFYKVPISVQVP